MIGDLQSVNERMADRPGWRGRLGEKIRRAGDFEHWAAFIKSFLRLSELIAGSPIIHRSGHRFSVLSGDVHHSYAARAELTARSRATGSRRRASTGVFAGAQLRARVRQTGIQARVVEADGSGSRVGGRVATGCHHCL